MAERAVSDKRTADAGYRYKEKRGGGMTPVRSGYFKREKDNNHARKDQVSDPAEGKRRVLAD